MEPDPGTESSIPDAFQPQVPPTTKNASRERLQALERGLETLSFLNRFGAGTSTQVAKALGLKRSTAHRILAVLVNLGLVRHDALNHQYILCSRVRELSSGFRDEEWVSNSALPSMKAWTAEHHWPLVLTTELAGKLVVRASTDYESPMSVDRFHCGQIVPIEGSTAGLIYLAYAGRISAAPDVFITKLHKPMADDDTLGASPEELSRIRAAGYVARPTACFTGGRVSVPLRPSEPFVGCITMRARAENIEVISEVHGWVASLTKLAESIDCAAAMTNQLAPDKS
jgi:IclR family mhp operon transcriptional activator